MTNDQRPKQATILVIDDDRIALDLIMLTFNATATVLTALNSENGLEIAVNEQPDLILLDTLIQDVDGHEICSQLKSMPETENIPVIILSNSNQIEDELAALDKGAIDFITKPIEAPILKARVANHLFQKRDRDQLKLMSSIDALTGVANRRRFDEYLHLEWRRAIRSKYPISLLMIDIDYFKTITYQSQESGDHAIKKVAAWRDRRLLEMRDRRNGLWDQDRRLVCNRARWASQAGSGTDADWEFAWDCIAESLQANDIDAEIHKHYSNTEFKYGSDRLIYAEYSVLEQQYDETEHD